MKNSPGLSAHGERCLRLPSSSTRTTLSNDIRTGPRVSTSPLCGNAPRAASEIPRKILRTRVAATLRQVFSSLADLGIFGRIIPLSQLSPVVRSSWSVRGIWKYRESMSSQLEFNSVKYFTFGTWKNPSFFGDKSRVGRGSWKIV